MRIEFMSESMDDVVRGAAEAFHHQLQSDTVSRYMDEHDLTLELGPVEITRLDGSVTDDAVHIEVHPTRQAGAASNHR